MDRIEKNKLKMDHTLTKEESKIISPFTSTRIEKETINEIDNTNNKKDDRGNNEHNISKDKVKNKNSPVTEKIEELEKLERIEFRRRVSSILIPEKVHTTAWQTRVKSRLKYAAIVYFLTLLFILKHFGDFYYIATRLTYEFHGPVIPFCAWKYISNFDAWNVALPDSNSFYHISEFYLDEGDEIRIKGESLPYARYFSFQTYSLTDLVALDSVRDFDIIVDSVESQIDQGIPVGYNAYSNITAAQNKDRLGSYTIYLTALKDQNYTNELKALPGNQTRGIFNLFLRVYVEEKNQVHLPEDIKRKKLNKAWGYVPPPIIEIKRKRECKCSGSKSKIKSKKNDYNKENKDNKDDEEEKQEEEKNCENCSWQTLPFCHIRRKSGFRINRMISDLTKPILRCQKFDGFDNKKNHWVYGTKKLKVGKYANKDAEYMGSCANTLSVDLSSTLSPSLQSTSTRKFWLYLCKFLHQHHVNLLLNLFTSIEEMTADTLHWVYHWNVDLWIAMNKGTLLVIFSLGKVFIYPLVLVYDFFIKTYLNNYFSGWNHFENNSVALQHCKDHQYKDSMSKLGKNYIDINLQDTEVSSTDSNIVNHDEIYDDYGEDDNEEDSEIPFPFNLDFFSSSSLFSKLNFNIFNSDFDIAAEPGTNTNRESSGETVTKGPAQKGQKITAAVSPYKRLYARIDAKLPTTPTSLYESPFIANFSDYNIRYVSFNINARTIPLRGYMSIKDSEIAQHYNLNVYHRRQLSSTAAKAWKDWKSHRFFTIWVVPFDIKAPFLPKEVEESEGLVLRWGKSIFNKDIAYPAILYRQILPSSEITHQKFDSPEALSHLASNLCDWDAKCCDLETDRIKASLMKDNSYHEEGQLSDQSDPMIPFDKTEYCFHPKNVRNIMQNYYPNITYFISSQYPTATTTTTTATITTTRVDPCEDSSQANKKEVEEAEEAEEEREREREGEREERKGDNDKNSKNSKKAEEEICPSRCSPNSQSPPIYLLPYLEDVDSIA